jgi:hypothetical protein
MTYWARTWTPLELDDVRVPQAGEAAQDADLGLDDAGRPPAGIEELEGGEAPARPDRVPDLAEGPGPEAAVEPVPGGRFQTRFDHGDHLRPRGRGAARLGPRQGNAQE